MQPENLPPTLSAAEYHSLHVYLPVQIWKRESCLSPHNLGWKEVEAKLLPVQCGTDSVPKALLGVVRCNCKIECAVPVATQGWIVPPPLETGEAFIIIYYYLLLFIIIYYYLLLFIIIYYYLLLFIIIYYYLLLFIIIYYYLLLFIIIYYYLLLFIIIYYYLLLFILIYYYVLLFIIIYYYLLFFIIY